ncbi:MAG: glycosyltransferase family 4 protein [Candidatus Aenigmatarchaeota archaeon]
MIVAHIYANEKFEPRGYKFVKKLKENNYTVLELLKPKNQSYLRFIITTLINLYKSKPDVVHAHRISGFVPAILAKIINPHLKIIFDKHDIHKLDFIFDRLTRFFADYVIVASDLHKKRMLNFHNNVEVLYNYSWFKKASKREIESARKEFGVKKEDIVVLFQGSVIKDYGLDLLLHAVKNLSKKIKIVVIGWIKDPIYWENCRKIYPDIIYLGAKEYEQMYKYISAADIGVVLFKKNKLTEYGNPNKLFEFFACKVPVIVSDVKSISKYVKNGKNGFVIKNEQELQKAIDKLQNRNLRKKISKNIPNFKWENEFKKYLTILETLHSK